MSDSARQAMGLPRVFSPDPACPAGRPIFEGPKGSGVLCRLTDSQITTVDDPHSLSFCCTQAYKRCPVWRAEKERIAERRRDLLVDEREAARESLVG